MCDSEEIRRIHGQTNEEIRCVLNSLSEHAAAVNDEELEALTIRLREVLGKRFLINGIVDWQSEE